MRLFTKARRRTLKSCEGRVLRISDNEFKVKDYTVYKSSRKGWLCECKHFVYKQTPCSHIVYIITRELKPQLVRLEVKDVPHRLNEVMLREAYDMYGFVPMLAVISVMSPLREPIRIPPRLYRHR